MPVEIPDLLEQVAGLLHTLGVPYMVTGSIGSTFYGEPRSTNDIDLVVDPTREQLLALLDKMPANWMTSPEAAKDAFNRRTMFNVIHMETSEKVDMILLKDRDFSRAEFLRRRPERMGNADIFLLSPEDAIISKLEWSRLGESERQYRDALSVARARWSTLDVEYIEKWVKELGLTLLWSRVMNGVRCPPT